jgi:hypothetical protein
MLIGLSFYGALNPASDTYEAMSNVFHLIRQDCFEAITELWSALTKTCATLYETIAIAKMIEIIIIGITLSCLPDALEFFKKTLAKLAKP